MEKYVKDEIIKGEPSKQVEVTRTFSIKKQTTDKCSPRKDSHKVTETIFFSQSELPKGSCCLRNDMVYDVRANTQKNSTQQMALPLQSQRNTFLPVKNERLLDLTNSTNRGHSNRFPLFNINTQQNDQISLNEYSYAYSSWVDSNNMQTFQSFDRLSTNIKCHFGRQNTNNHTNNKNSDTNLKNIADILMIIIIIYSR